MIPAPVAETETRSQELVVALHVYSFGWGHRDPNVPHCDIVCDIRDWFRNPDIDPELRDKNGRDPQVIAEVLGTRGVDGYLNGLFVLTRPLIRAHLRTVTVAIGCAGGRHRAPVIADRLATDVAKLLDVTTSVTHLHIDRPVLPSRSNPFAEIQETVNATMRRAADRLKMGMSCASCWPRPCDPDGTGSYRSACHRQYADRRAPGLCDGCDRTDQPVTATDDGRALVCPTCLPFANAGQPPTDPGPTP